MGLFPVYVRKSHFQRLFTKAFGLRNNKSRYKKPSIQHYSKNLLKVFFRIINDSTGNDGESGNGNEYLN